MGMAPRRTLQDVPAKRRGPNACWLSLLAVMIAASLSHMAGFTVRVSSSSLVTQHR